MFTLSQFIIGVGFYVFWARLLFPHRYEHSCDITLLLMLQNKPTADDVIPDVWFDNNT